MVDRGSFLSGVRSLVVKVGTWVLTSPEGGIDQEVVEKLAEDISSLVKEGRKVVLVSSGAIAAGMRRLGLGARPREISKLQAVAAVGQSLLMNAYEGAFRRHGVPVGQVLLTSEDILNNRVRYLNLRATFQSLFSLGVLPVVNENDSVATEEIRMGDNDVLAAHVTNLVDADLLVLLTDTEGLYTSDPRKDRGAEVIKLVEKVTPEIEALAGDPGGPLGSGGMRTKVEAAKMVTTSGKMALIAHGKEHGLRDVLSGREVGTLFLPQGEGISGRKRWIAFNLEMKGKLFVDPGAEEAIVRRGKSLLPSGITHVEGEFGMGDMVGIVGPSGEVARGLVNYSADEVRRIRGRRSSEIEDLLGYKYSDEVVHRDNMVVMFQGG
ncbi:MAG: glutamate 5-kinase [Candidatus Latescibacterota bacterium]|nr:MAG: glutamate 5-kinase [Candidatus Latescibacterota bacterium]RKY64920.1 MAG: glutamate 5-kinase [Candidatus Latescibacterota bacterium]